jgi:hypothetical protein
MTFPPAPVGLAEISAAFMILLNVTSLANISFVGILAYREEFLAIAAVEYFLEGVALWFDEIHHSFAPHDRYSLGTLD